MQDDDHRALAIGAFRFKADIEWQSGPAGSVENDPYVWSGRALQEVFVDPADAVLHQCIRPLFGARCAPGHHGYQRACDLITGQASTGLFGSPVFACAGKTDLHHRLILSQTSAGKLKPRHR